MSTKELIEEANKLLESSWEEHEKILVKRILDTMVSYKSFIPKSLKADIKAILIMANRIKNEYDELVVKYKLKNDKEVLELDVEKLDVEKLDVDVDVEKLIS